MPGEIAEAHQHVSSAIRFVLDGEGAYTAVEGEKANMSRGDFILTPNWAPHDHGNPGKKPVMWLDVLDMPTINHFETSFMEHFDEKAQNTDAPGRRLAGALRLRRAAGRQAIDTFKHRSPVINYTYARTKPILERLMKAGDVDPRHGARVRYSNPVTGGHVMATMGAYLALFPKGFKGKDYQSTDGTIFVCVEGHGSTKVDDKVLEWGPNDVFVIPPWKRYSHTLPGASRCCSRSPTGRRRKRSASGARRPVALRTGATIQNAPRKRGVFFRPATSRPFPVIAFRIVPFDRHGFRGNASPRRRASGGTRSPNCRTARSVCSLSFTGSLSSAKHSSMPWSCRDAIEFGQHVGGRDVDAGHRLRRDDEPPHRRRRRRHRAEHSFLEQFGVGEEQRRVPAEHHQSGNAAGRRDSA